MCWFYFCDTFVLVYPSYLIMDKGNMNAAINILKNNLQNDILPINKDSLDMQIFIDVSQMSQES